MLKNKMNMQVRSLVDKLTTPPMCSKMPRMFRCYLKSEVLIMKKIFLLFIIVCLYACTAYAAFPTTGAAQTPYCFVPPYLTQNVKPNINLIFDMSGSMQEPANIPSASCSGGSAIPALTTCTDLVLATTAADRYISTKDYYGYFDSSKYYKYDSTNSYFIDNSSACTAYTNKIGSTNGVTGSAGCISGNLLNWILTSRLDTVRKIFTGGRTRTTGTTPANSFVLQSDASKYKITDQGLRCIFTVNSAPTGTSNTSYTIDRTISIANQSGYTCALGTLTTAAKANVVVPSEDVTGVIQGLYNVADLEVMVFGETSARYKVEKLKTSVTPYIDAVNNESPDSSTPTGAAMTAALNFWLQNSSAQALVKATVGATTTYLKDPYYDSDGGTTPNSVAVPCRKSFNLLISDGQWPDTTVPTFASTMPSGVNPADPLTAVNTMHTTDMRTALNGGDTTNKRTVTTYAVYAYGAGGNDPGRNSMIAMAIFGGYEDKYGAHSATTTTTTANGYPYPFTRIPYDSRSTQTNANTVQYALSKCNPAGTWDQECVEWDKDKTGLPYNYYEGSDGAQLQESITKAVKDMLTRASSGTAASMLGNTDSSGAVMLQALFFPERQFTDSTKAKWLGDVQAFWYYLDPSLSSAKVTLREDTVQDNKLKKTEDRIAKFVFDGTNTRARLYEDANGDGVEDSSTYVEENVEEVKALWRAGLSLWSRMPAGTGGRTVYTNNLSGTATSNNLMVFSADTTQRDLIKPFLDVASNDTDSTNVIKYTLGIDPLHNDLSTSEKDTALTGYRSRTVKIGTATHVWKLGDIINSTPKMISPAPLNTYNANPPGGYRDTSYDRFISTLSYKNRGVAFVGGNDGMLHAFKLGKNIPGSKGYVSQIVDSTDLNGTNSVAATDLGKELWAYIPKNVLPYLKHRGNPNYMHMYYVDSTPTLIDASIAIVDKQCSNDPIKWCATDTDCGTGTPAPTCNTISPACTGSNCPKLDKSWRTVLIGSMGLGGATRNSTATCSTSTDCVKTPISGTGYSSYFALDVTDSSAPKLLWEFSDPGLGYSTVGPAIVRIRDASDAASGTSSKNGKFYVVLASGPTGPVDTGINQMKGYSDQPLNLYVLDMRTGAAVQTFSNSATALISGVTHTQFTAMPNLAFGGAFSNSTIDTDKSNASRVGNYSDDAVYLGYIRKGVTGDTPAASIGKFAKGGILRILTADDPNPANWKISKVIDGIGPVTNAVTKLQDTFNKKLWLYFGTGRYYFKNGSTIDEDYTDQNEAIYGVADPCYSVDTSATKFNDMDSTCTSTVLTSALENQTSTFTAVTNSNNVKELDSTKKGWLINLGGASGSFKAKRVYTNPTATSNGVIFFTAFKPSAEVCSYGGDTSIWAVNYATGGSVGGSNLRGQAMLQLATGELKQVDLSTAFTQSQATGDAPGGRETLSFKGPPSKDETQFTSNANHTPVKKILHIMER